MKKIDYVREVLLFIHLNFQYINLNLYYDDDLDAFVIEHDFKNLLEHEAVKKKLNETLYSRSIYNIYFDYKKPKITILKNDIKEKITKYNYSEDDCMSIAA